MMVFLFAEARPAVEVAERYLPWKGQENRRRFGQVLGERKKCFVQHWLVELCKSSPVNVASKFSYVVFQDVD